MNLPVMPFDHDKSPYERPNQKWVCGRASDGAACAIGPDSRGGCRATTECQPVRRGDRWECARSRQHGGSCEQGPLPDGTCCRAIRACQPVLSLRARRGRLVWAVTAAVLGLLLLSASGPWWVVIFQPGELSSHHGQILGGAGAQSCAACHEGGARSPLEVLAGLQAASTHAQTSQVSGCLGCHANSPGLGGEAFAPHGLSAADIQQIHSRQNAGPAPQQVAAVKDVPEAIACSICHREHRGADFDLKAMSNAQCQSCHQKDFHRFSAGHPEFTDWPFNRRTRMIFDHAAHQAKHFGKYNTAFDCRSCHVPDVNSQDMVLKPFAAACAQCHQAGIQSSGEKGLALLQLPGIDVESLEEKDQRVGEWPEDATIDIEGKLNPFMHLLLLGDEDGLEALDVLKGEFVLNDFDPQKLDEEKLEAVAMLGWAVKGLLRDVIVEGHQALKMRLEEALRRKLSDEEAQELFGQISPEAVRAAALGWFPNLFAEVETWRSGKNPAKPAAGAAAAKAPKPLSVAKRLSGGGWMISESDFALKYVPAAHGDSFVKAWIDLSIVLPQAKGGKEAAASLGKLLQSPTAPGACLKCHSREQNSSAPMTIAWGTEPSDLATRRSLMHFSHAPHLIQPHLADCSACHTLAGGTDVLTTYSQMDPRQFQPSFEPVARSLCAQCHKPQAAGDSCLKCHRYHGGPTLARPKIKSVVQTAE